ncbi:AarF/UbiB family protein [Gaetbulibacter saemankumensis]|uniref:AarF/UbiB family protein n=1 Tax=Gaetbulibacter saemankumensis TaxID=311208 RepID=UPI000423F230|nr:AarF/UbiB family protein [Gaetbulibacter saemankumensis]
MFANLKYKYKSIVRYNQILRVLLKYGFEDLVKTLKDKNKYTFLRRFVPKSSRRHAEQFTKWEKMRLVCEELGPTFVKFGQILSNRPDLIPFDLVLQFEKLQDNVPPMPDKMAKEVVVSELHDEIENLFAWFAPKPFASASMAQVHKVTLKSGKRIALKIQRPGIKQIILEDIKVMYNVADILEHRIPSLKSFDPVGLVRNFEQSILKELDFIHESINAQRFYNNLMNDTDYDQYASAPKVYPEYTTEKILALEFISGVKIDKMRKLEESGMDKKVIAKRLSVSFFKQIFEYGFFHADPHPGNLLVLPNRHICYLDFGMMGSILPRDIRVFGDLFLAITQKDVNKIIRALQQLSNETVIRDMRKLEFEINEFVEKYYVREVHQNEISTILLELKDIIVANDLKVPTHFYLFARAMVTIEGVVSKLDPKLDQFEVVRPYLSKTVARNYNPLILGKKVLNSIFEISDYLEEFPKDLKNAIRKINSGQIKVDLTHKGVDAMVNTIHRVTKQIVTAFIIVALIVGSTLFTINEISPLWNGVSAMAIIGFSLAFILGIGLVRDLIKKDYNNW